ncbi:dehydratase [Helicobacter anseris]|uniref:Dehydratase n=1 Tax=Helicobacter anseris TaxID=375926 RepID=A0A3D8J9Q9_9HELI|nr:MaoC/PaaZ C-terminal domain-containing protein [Helicobacter anseris]RDU73604.1 dehydratase [Helicobacter anseris]
MKSYKFQDLSIGQKESFEVTLEQRHMDLFLQVSEDTNPLHTNLEYAKGCGFENLVAYGLLTTSFYSKLIGVYLPGKYSLLHGVDVSFLKPVFVGDKLLVEGKIDYINEAYRQIEIQANIFKESGGGGYIRVSKAKIKVGVLQ